MDSSVRPDCPECGGQAKDCPACGGDDGRLDVSTGAPRKEARSKRAPKPKATREPRAPKPPRIPRTRPAPTPEVSDQFIGLLAILFVVLVGVFVLANL